MPFLHIRKALIASAFAGALVTAGALAQTAMPSKLGAGVTRVDLQRHDISIPGHEALQARVDLAPGVLAARHKHPGEEIIYVLKGTLVYDIDGQGSRTVKPGDVLFVPAETFHSVRNIGSDEGSELATYVVEKGKPLVVLDK